MTLENKYDFKSSRSQEKTNEKLNKQKAKELRHRLLRHPLLCGESVNNFYRKI